MKKSALLSIKKKTVSWLSPNLRTAADWSFNEWAIFVHRKTDDQFWLQMLVRD
jgi:hypothetical protein